MNQRTLITYLVCFLRFSLSSVLAADYYVSSSGSDASGDGSVALPWATFTKGVNALGAGDSLMIRGGTYAQRLQLSSKTGTLAHPISIKNYNGEVVVLDGGTLTVPNSGSREGLLEITNCNYVQLEGITVSNYKTSINGRVPVGIAIEGSGSGVSVKGCTVTEIWQSSGNGNANGFGISVYGTATTPIDGLILEGNTVHNLRTGQSESVVINGNVTNFLVTKNHLYNCNNIGIDFIGYEGSAPSAVDRARDGVCSENLVHDIDSAFNPGYGGDFTSGGGDQSAAGIYVDGGTNIIIERNEVYGCNYGIELAAEDASGFTDYIIMRNNLIHHNMLSGIIMGGYDKDRGVTRFCKVLNNTIYKNDTLNDYAGEIGFQFYLENNTFKNNIIWANSSTNQAIVNYVEGGTSAQETFDTTTNTFDFNVYYITGSANDLEFGLNVGGTNQFYSGLATWRAALGGSLVGDAASSVFVNPGFSTATPSGTPAASDFMLAPTSGSRNIGETSPDFTPAADEKDYFGSSRVADLRVDAGFHEYMTVLQQWRDTYFSAPDGGVGSGADDTDDVDGDGFSNLIEYSQGMDPTKKDADAAPKATKSGALYRFEYRKDGAGLSYDLQTATDDFSNSSSGWSVTSAAEADDGNGLYWRDFDVTGLPRFFVRLRVTQD